jgi:hypothetical protein
MLARLLEQVWLTLGPLARPMLERLLSPPLLTLGRAPPLRGLMLGPVLAPQPPRRPSQALPMLRRPRWLTLARLLRPQPTPPLLRLPLSRTPVLPALQEH